jgi:hypothetical protein
MSSALPLSATDNKRLARCAREANELLAKLFAIDHPGTESMSIIRQLRQLMPKLDALTNVPPALCEIIAAGPDGAGLGMHLQPVSALWPEYRKQLHEAASASLESVVRDAESADDGELPTIWFHAERQYSIDRKTPFVVSDELDSILQAFLESQGAMETSDIEDKAGVTNVSRAMRDLAEWNESVFKQAIRIPSGKGKGGYFVRVKRL